MSILPGTGTLLAVLLIFEYGPRHGDKSGADHNFGFFLKDATK